MNPSRRGFVAKSVLASAGLGVLGPLGLAAGAAEPKADASTADKSEEASSPQRGNPIAVSTYSYWRFRDDSKLPIDKCIDLAAEMGFDGVEILHIQMTDESNAALQKLKQRAFLNGLALCGFSTHQGFLSPDKDERKKNIDHTLHCIELAYKLGIPTMRVNTGRWGTSKNFDELMRNRGIEPRLEGHTDEEGGRLTHDEYLSADILSDGKLN